MQRISIQQIQSFEQFYRIPKVFFTSEKYKNMKLESKTAYAILRDRFELSLKNGWVDEDQNVYFIFTVTALQKILGCGKNKVISIKKDLTKYGLLEEEKRGFNRANRLYIGAVTNDFFSEKSSEPMGDKEVSKSNLHWFENQTSGGLKTEPPVVSKSNPNDTDLSDTDSNHTENKFFEEDDEPNIFNKQNSQATFDPKHKTDVELLAEQYAKDTNCQITPIKKRKLDELVNRFGGLLVSEAITKAALNGSESLVYIQKVCETLDQEQQERLNDYQTNKSKSNVTVPMNVDY